MLLELTEQQYGHLRRMRLNRRVLVDGPAGSGKTVLAVYKAEELCREGLSVWLVCYNQLLAEHLRAEMSYRVGPVGEGRLYVGTFHGLVGMLSRKCGLPPIGGEVDVRDGAYAVRIRELAALLAGSVDALIVDEAQNFEAEWLEQLILFPGPSGVCYVFQDESQRVYRTDPFAGEMFSRCTLDRIVRCARPVSELVAALYDGPALAEPNDVPGPGPEFVEEARVSEDPGVLEKVLADLVRSRHVVPGSIAVLTPRTVKGGSRLAPGMRIGEWELVDRGQKPDDRSRILLSTIHRFQGLERDVVVLAELELLENPQERRRLLYLGASRARVLLVALGAPAHWFGRTGLQSRAGLETHWDAGSA